MILLAVLVQAWGMLRASKYFHWFMLTHTLRAPLKFFDTTPIGRIVNRFGKDIDILDRVLPQTIRNWLLCLLEVNNCYSFTNFSMLLIHLT